MKKKYICAILVFLVLAVLGIVFGMTMINTLSKVLFIIMCIVFGAALAWDILSR